MKIAITEIASFNFGINELVITKDKLFALIARKLGYSEFDQRLDGYDDDYIVHHIVICK